MRFLDLVHSHAVGAKIAAQLQPVIARAANSALSKGRLAGSGEGPMIARGSPSLGGKRREESRSLHFRR